MRAARARFHEHLSGQQPGAGEASLNREELEQ